MFMVFSTSLVVFFIAVLLQSFTAIFLVCHFCDYTWAIVRYVFIGSLVLLWFSDWHPIHHAKLVNVFIQANIVPVTNMH